MRKKRRLQLIERRLSFEEETGRRQFASGTDHTDPQTVHVVWSTAINILRPVLVGAKIDLYPNPLWTEQFEALSMRLGRVTNCFERERVHL